MMMVGFQVVLKRTWAPSIANGQISHGQQRRYRHRDGQRRKAFVTGARDGDSDKALLSVT